MRDDGGVDCSLKHQHDWICPGNKPHNNLLTDATAETIFWSFLGFQARKPTRIVEAIAIKELLRLLVIFMHILSFPRGKLEPYPAPPAQLCRDYIAGVEGFKSTCFRFGTCAGQVPSLASYLSHRSPMHRSRIAQAPELSPWCNTRISMGTRSYCEMNGGQVSHDAQHPHLSGQSRSPHRSIWGHVSPHSMSPLSSVSAKFRGGVMQRSVAKDISAFASSQRARRVGPHTTTMPTAAEHYLHAH